MSSHSGAGAVRRIGFVTCFAIVVANMIGTGVFTSLGFQLEAVNQPLSIMLIWLLGGVFALCGALSYVELATTLPRSGGEYHFLSVIYHPSLGFMAGVVSMVAGFSAPVALAALAFGKYFTAVAPDISSVGASLLLVALVTAFHLWHLGVSAAFQNVFSALKIVLVAGLAIAGFLYFPRQPLDWRPTTLVLEEIWNPAFAVSLMFALYAFSGWNAAAYIVGESRDPSKNVGRALLWGTLTVLVLYLGLNAAFLLVAPVPEMRGQLDIGRIYAENLLGAEGGKIISVLICLGLVSAVSAMTWAGPRVSMAMGEDWRAFGWLAKKNRGGIPVVAVMLQFLLVVVLILSGSFESVLVYTQFALVACSALAVLGVIVLRKTQPDLPRPFPCIGYPYTPILFLGICLFAMGYTLLQKPVEAIAGLCTLLFGLCVFFVLQIFGKNSQKA